MAKFDDFLTEIAEFFAIFGKMALQKFFVPDPGGLLEVCWNVFLVFPLALLCLIKYLFSKLKISVIEL